MWNTIGYPKLLSDEKSVLLDLHKKDTKIESEIKTELLKKYFAYARQNMQPKLTDAAISEIKRYSNT